VQHRLAHVLTGMGLSERNKIWAASRIRERSCRTRFPLFGGIAELPENADEPPPRDLRGELRHYLKLEHTLPSDQTKCLGLRGQSKAAGSLSQPTEGRRRGGVLQGSIPVNKFFDGVTITRFASAELRLFSTAALTCSRSGKRRTDLVLLRLLLKLVLLHDRWPQCHRLMIRVVPRL